MTMTEQKLQNLTYDKQKQTGWYLSRLGGIPGMSANGRFNRVVRTYGYKCAFCNTINPSLSIDHIIQRVRGGTSDIDNLQLLCLIDHRRKDNKLKKVKKKRLLLHFSKSCLRQLFPREVKKQ
jgi:5-methylcytosine-specific restriction endonuclease McrA